MSAAQRVEAGSDSKQTVLFVEDDALLRASLAEFLRDSNFLVLEAGNIGEAIDVLMAAEVDLLLADVGFTGAVDGFHLADWAQARFPHLPVLMTSGRAPSSAALMRRPNREFVLKPCAYEVIVERIQKMLAGPD